MLIEYFFYYPCRQGAGGSRAHRGDPEKKGTRESRAIPAPDANAELVVSMQVLFLFMIIFIGCSVLDCHSVECSCSSQNDQIQLRDCLMIC